MPANLVAIGEVGLAGEVRKVSNLAARLREAERIGFRRAVVPAGSEGLDGLRTSMTIIADQQHPIGDGSVSMSPHPTESAYTVCDLSEVVRRHGVSS